MDDANNTEIKAGTTYLCTIRRIDGVVIKSTVTKIGRDGRVHYLNGTARMVSPSVAAFASCHKPE